VRRRVRETNLSIGREIGGCCGTWSDVQAAVAVAKAAEVVVLTVGIDGSIEREGHDRHNTTLPPMQACAEFSPLTL
jgi:hypothetical protein